MNPTSLANDLGVRSLLNCYLREICGPKNLVGYFTPFEALSLPNELKHQVKGSDKAILKIDLPHSNYILATVSGARPNLLGIYPETENSFIHIKEVGSQWTRLTGKSLAEILENELSGAYSRAKEPDFLVQVQDSIRVTDLILRDSRSLEIPDTLSFVDSEQALVYGHPFHPNPKSRFGLLDNEVKQYSPELKSCFQLHYFSVHQDYVIQDSIEDRSTSQLILANLADRDLPSLDDGHTLIPTHPWQARHLLQMPEIQSALSTGRLYNLGLLGSKYFPTSSVRTVYSPESTYFYKLSLNVRITNCFRRNALTELQNSVEVTRLMREYKDTLKTRYPSFCALDEPAYITTDLGIRNPTIRQKITEGFGVILRKSMKEDLYPHTTSILAASLFGNQDLGRTWIQKLIPNSEDRENWFDLYIGHLIPPLLELFFDQGIMFEPHLQNSLVGIREGVPVQIFIRDFDNARIVHDSPASQLLAQWNSKISIEAFYSYNQAWNRFIYCLFVNHLGEAITQLSYLNPTLERLLWNLVRDRLMRYSASTPNGRAKSAIEQLLNCTFLPAKRNMVTRFQRTPDSNASYIDVPNPLKL